MGQDERLRSIRASLRDRPAEARRAATSLLAAARRAKDGRCAAMARFLRGDACQIVGAMRAAERDYEAARDWFDRNGEERLARLVDLSDLQVQALRGRADRFRAALRRLRGALRKPIEAAVVEQAAGNGWRALGREEKAEECFRSALDRLGRGRDERARVLRAHLQQDLGVAEVHRGAASSGVSRLERARATLVDLKRAHAAHMTDANLGWARGVAGDFAAACEALPSAARALRRDGDHRRAWLARLDEADARRRLGDDVRAHRTATAVAAALQRAGLHGEAARARLVASRAQAALGRPAAARAHARRAAALFARAGDRGGAAEARLQAGEMDASMWLALGRAGRWTAAIDAVLAIARAQPPARAARTLERAHRRLPAVFRPWLQPDRFRARAGAEPARRIAWLRRAVRAAEALRDRAPTATLRAASLARHAELYESLATALLDRGRASDRREAFAVIDAARARTLREELDRLAPGIGLPRRLRALRRRLEELWRAWDDRDRGAPSPTGMRGPPDPILREIRRFERDWSEAWSDRLAAAPRRPQPPGALAAAAGPVACLTFARTGARCTGLLAQEGEVHAWDAGSMASLLAERDAFRFQVRRRLFGAEDGRALAALLDRLGARLFPGGWSPPARLRVVLPESFGDLPLEALPVGGTPLIERCELHHAPCASWRPRAWTARGACAFIGLSAPGLPEIDREVESAARRMGGDVVRGAEATRSAILAALRRSRLVHLAGHADTRDDAPPLSALRAPDGWVTAADLAGARLRGGLVVLSGCRTGDPALQWLGESLGGFPRALLAAGASGIVASRWPVRDELARAWMEAFYEALAGASPAAAVRAAARAMRAAHPHPVDWSSFLFVQGAGG